jgi:hypothetical protein
MVKFGEGFIIGYGGRATPFDRESIENLISFSFVFVFTDADC